MILNELCRRVDPQNRTLAAFVRQELGSLGLDVRIGMDSGPDLARTRRLTLLSPWAFARNALAPGPADAGRPSPSLYELASLSYTMVTDYAELMRKADRLWPRDFLHLMSLPFRPAQVRLGGSSALLNFGRVINEPEGLRGAELPSASAAATTEALATMAAFMANGNF